MLKSKQEATKVVPLVNDARKSTMCPDGSALQVNMVVII